MLTLVLNIICLYWLRAHTFSTMHCLKFTKSQSNHHSGNLQTLIWAPLQPSQPLAQTSPASPTTLPTLMGSVGDTFVCPLCHKWRPGDGYELYDACDWVPIACSRCQARFWKSGLPCWRDVFLIEPLKNLGFCKRLPMDGNREIWLAIMKFMITVPHDRDMECGDPCFLWYDDMVSHWMGPQELFMKYPQVPVTPETAEMASLSPLTPCHHAAARQRRSCSAPARLYTLAHPDEEPAEPVEPLLIQPARPLSSEFLLALGLPCKPDSIWALRHEKEWNQRGGSFRPWRRRKWHGRPKFPYQP